VVPMLARKHTPTGSSVIVVTPDSQRTMFTYLGACRDLDTRDVDLPRARAARVLHTTGYMWDTENQEEAARRAVAAARAGHSMVSFDVADPFVVRRSFDSLVDWIPGNVDVLFANDEELQALTGTRGQHEDVLRAAAAFAPTVAMKIGKRGCMVIHEGTVISAEAYPAERVDTTGAGDAFAAGYLYGLLHGMGTAACAAIANAFAASIVSVDGCNYDALEGARVRAAVEQASASFR
jgi:sugar/nucleoside kinase (ribokinase family)